MGFFGFDKERHPGVSFSMLFTDNSRQMNDVWRKRGCKKLPWTLLIFYVFLKLIFMQRKEDFSWVKFWAVELFWLRFWRKGLFWYNNLFSFAHPRHYYTWIHHLGFVKSVFTHLIVKLLYSSGLEPTEQESAYSLSILRRDAQLLFREMSPHSLTHWKGCLGLETESRIEPSWDSDVK